MFSSLFDPLPPPLSYEEPQALPFLALAVALLIASFFLSRWRKKLQNPVTKKLSATWPKAAFAFGFAALILLVARVESIRFLAMPFWWVLWALIGALFVFAQYRVFSARHYQVVKGERVEDPREKYLPKRKR